MAEANELTAEQLQQKLTELESKVTTLATDKEYWEKEAKSAFGKRDEFKQKLETIDKETLEKNNQFKDLYEKEQQAKNDLQKLFDEVNPYKEKWTNFETTRRETLLTKVIDEDLKKVYQKYDLNDLELVVAKLESKPVSTDSSRSGGGSFNYDGKKWDEISSANKEKLAKDQPELYRKIYYEKYRKEPVI